MKNQTLTQLEELNLSPNEAKVYLALVETGLTSAGEIIKKTGFHRSVVYETLDKLMERKLITRLTKQHIAHFQALEPDRLLQNIHRQEAIAKDLIGDLKKLAKMDQSEITVYEGAESYRRFWLESMERMPKGSTDYVAGSIGKEWYEIMGDKALKRYFKIAQERDIRWKMIVFDKDDYEKTFLDNYPGFHWQTRFIDRPFSKEGNFNVFGMESVILHSATEPLIIEIKNGSLVKIFQNLFDILWENGIDMDTRSVRTERRKGS
ncbi:MAG TPA: helix-turn-helix domain-containing protein [Candidatus Fimivivens sp.]|nr:helix-turn-helix domain-containing protein [Candidatus Fimivivens sp.]